jgi:mannosyltransferase OCH1-like enzyme
MSFPIPEYAKDLDFVKNIIFYSNTFNFDESLPADFPDVNNIPRILHIIWVGNNIFPDYLSENLKKWYMLLPEWEIIFWTNIDITTEHFPEDIVNLLGKVEKGAQKADIMRYYIIEKYGGIYVDIDIVPYKSLELLIKQIPNTEAIICHDLDLTWKYIINAFFAAVPHHPIFIKACELCKIIEINKDPLYMYSGPRLLGEAVATAETHCVLLPTNFFYYNENYNGKLGTHLFAKEW